MIRIWTVSKTFKFTTYVGVNTSPIQAHKLYLLNTCRRQVFQGRPVCVQSYEDPKKQHSVGIVVTMKISSSAIYGEALASDEVK